MAHISKIGSSEFTIEFWVNLSAPDQRRNTISHGLHGIFSTLHDGDMGDGYSEHPNIPGGGNYKTQPAYNARDLNTYTDGIVGGFAIGYVYNYSKYLENRFGSLENHSLRNEIDKPAVTDNYFTRFRV